MLKYLAGVTVLLIACQSSEQRCERLGLELRLADVRERQVTDDLAALMDHQSRARVANETDSVRYWEARIDSLTTYHRNQPKPKTTDRSWFRRHCE